VSVLRVAEASAWIIGSLLLGWMLLDAWRTNRQYDESLLLSSREGEIEKDLREVESTSERKP
jgi:Tfp pilus assembly protein PilN